jgi:hypothetical protein
MEVDYVLRLIGALAYNPVYRSPLVDFWPI